MRKITLVIMAALILVLALSVASQIAMQSSLNVREDQNCITTFHNDTVPVYANITRIRNTYGQCFNAINQSNYNCVIGNESFQSNEIIRYDPIVASDVNCKTNGYTISSQSGNSIKERSIDFSSWGVCIQQPEGDCIAVYCGTLAGGSARNGVFNGCDGGKSCEKILVCNDHTDFLYKGSREDFVTQDPTYFLSQVPYKEVAK